MFYDNFIRICAERKESPSGVAKKIGLSNAAANGWKNGKKPSEVTLEKLSQYFGVPVSKLLDSESDSPIIYCNDCGLRYNAQDPEEVARHSERHIAWQKAVDKFGFCWTYEYRETQKADARNKISDGDISDKEHIDAQTTVFKALFSRSLSANNYDLCHVNFEDYVAMLLNQDFWRQRIPPRIYEKMVEMYGIKPGISEGTYYQLKKTPTPVSESGPAQNIIKIAGRDGSYVEKKLTDEQIAAMKALIDTLPDAPDDL